MSNVLVEKNKLDILANAISNKSGETLKLTLDEMVEAVDGIPTGDDLPKAGTLSAYFYGNIEDPNLWSLNGRYVNFNVNETKRGGYVTAESSGWVDEGSVDDSEITLELRGEYQLPSANLIVDEYHEFYTDGGIRKWRVKGYADDDDGTLKGWFEGYQGGNFKTFNAVRETTITPTTSSQTIGGANYMMEGAVTVNAMPEASLGVPVNSIDKTSTELQIGKSFPNYTPGYLSGIGTLYTTLPLEDKTVTPSTTSQTVTPTSKAYYLNSVTVDAMPSGTAGTPTATKGTVSNHSVSVTPSVTNTTGYITGGTKTGTAVSVSASELVSGTFNGVYAYGTYDVTNYASVQVPGGSEGTPTATKGTVSNHSVSVTPSVTNVRGFITGSTITGTAVTVSASELVSGTLNVTSSGTKDVTNYASASIPSGTEGTPTATKGTVSNHSVSITPSVTNTSGFISGGTKSGTAVTVSASELVSGSETKTENGTYDVTNLAEIVVDVQGGGGSTINVGKTTKTLATASNSIQFTGLSGNPTSFVVTSSADITANTNGVTAVVFDGTSLHGQILSTQATADTGFTKSYSGGTLTITATTGSFQANEYKLAYTYGGSTSDIETADVQVGSGATSITFSVTGRPVYWSCIFKSDFSTSSGYQRVIEVANDGTSTYGICLDSSAHASTTYWTASYSGGNLTITSQGTNAGGYFHQPGYYQLTYAVDESAPSYQTKTVTPTTSQQVITADSGYDALSQVTVNAMPSMTLPSSTSATSSGTSKATISASSSTQYLNIPTGYNATAQYYTISASGGGGGASVTTKTVTNSSASNVSISFTGLSGEPIAFAVKCNAQLTRSSNSSYYYVTNITYDGTNHHGNYWRMSNGTYYNDTTHYSHTYSNGTLTVTSSGSRSAAGGSFYNGTYELVYIY